MIIGVDMLRKNYIDILIGLIATFAISSAAASPIANDDQALTSENKPVRIPVLENDKDADQVTEVTRPNKGEARIIGKDVRYNPRGADDFLVTGHSRLDSFTYTVTNNSGETDVAVVTVTITGTDD